MKVIAEIPATPDEYKIKSWEQACLRPHVFIEKEPLNETDSLSNQENSDLDDSGLQDDVGRRNVNTNRALKVKQLNLK